MKNKQLKIRFDKTVFFFFALECKTLQRDKKGETNEVTKMNKLRNNFKYINNPINFFF